MSVIELKVSKVLGDPFLRCGMWWVDVIEIANGKEVPHSLLFSRESDAKAVIPGYLWKG